jgi:DNA-binding winged helix-turn-helix (wHTH) protein
MNTANKQLLQFGCFALDPLEHVLLRDGVGVPLTPKASRLCRRWFCAADKRSAKMN